MSPSAPPFVKNAIPKSILSPSLEQPSDKGTWGWRVEGHHLSLNFTLKDGQFCVPHPRSWVATPVRFAKDRSPACVCSPWRRNWAANSSNHSRSRAVQDGFCRHGGAKGDDHRRRAQGQRHFQTSEGLPSTSSLDEKQKGMLTRFIHEYSNACARRSQTRLACRDQKHGGLFILPGPAARSVASLITIRVQGKTFLIEYDNTQNDANHVHSVWRSFDGDFGRDLLGEHVKQAH
jgi:hypothetical protein